MKRCHNTIINRGIKPGQPPLQESALLDGNQECNHSSRLTQSGIRRLCSVQHVLNNKVKYHQPATLPLSARQPKCRSSYIKTSSRRIQPSFSLRSGRYPFAKSCSIYRCTDFLFFFCVLVVLFVCAKAVSFEWCFNCVGHLE